MSQTVIPITIDNQRCNGCGVCVPVCHERAMTVRAGKITIDAELCSTCSQCIALCPERALSWRQIHAAPRKRGGGCDRARALRARLQHPPRRLFELRSALI